METFTVTEGKDGKGIYMFGIENIYISLATIAHLLSGIPEVRDLQQRKLFGKWEGTHITFKFKGRDCVVMEPFGDNSLYWIGIQQEVEDKTDVSEIEECFKKYQIPIHRRIFGDMVSLRFLRFLLSSPKGAKGVGEQSKH